MSYSEEEYLTGARLLAEGRLTDSFLKYKIEDAVQQQGPLAAKLRKILGTS